MRWSELLWLGLITSWMFVLQTAAASGGATLWIQWKYSNPDSMLDDGRTCDRFSTRECDVYATFCLRNAASSGTGRGRCSLYQHKTSVHDNSAYLSFRDTSALQIPIPAPVPNFYTLEIDLFDSDYLPNYEFIGTFTAENFELTPRNEFQYIPMSNKNTRTPNKRLRVYVDAKLVCKESYYGKHCDTKCVPDQARYDCNEDGARICKPGFTGEHCELEDSCFYEQCAPHATCKNRDDGSGRHCYCNGREAPECYPNYDPCKSKPCKHEGICNATGQYGESFNCVCTEHWTGHRCTERRLACLEAAELLREKHDTWTNKSLGETDTIEVCLNGGKCLEYSDRFAYSCDCAPGWTGKRCAEPMPLIHASFNLLYILIALSAAFTSLLVIAIVAAFMWRRRKSKWNNSHFVPRQGGIVYYHSDRDSTGTMASILQTNPQLANEIYGSPTLTEKSYLASPSDRYARFVRKNRNDVYDECDPLGLEDQADPYGTAFENEGMISKNEELAKGNPSGRDDDGPPLPERMYDRPSTLQISALGSSDGEKTVPSTWQTFKTPEDVRKPTVYRALSPTFTPTTVERGSRTSMPI